MTRDPQVGIHAIYHDMPVVRREWFTRTDDHWWIVDVEIEQRAQQEPPDNVAFEFAHPGAMSDEQFIAGTRVACKGRGWKVLTAILHPVDPAGYSAARARHQEGPG